MWECENLRCATEVNRRSRSFSAVFFAMPVEMVIHSWFGYCTDMLQVIIWSKSHGNTRLPVSLSLNDFHNQFNLIRFRIKAHGTQCLEENAGKYDRNDDTCLYCSTSHGSAARDERCQYESTMGAHCSCSAYAPLLRRSRLRYEMGISITGTELELLL